MSVDETVVAAIVTRWMPVTVSTTLVAVTVMTWVPVTVQVKATVSFMLLMAGCVTGDCPVACQV